MAFTALSYSTLRCVVETLADLIQQLCQCSDYSLVIRLGLEEYLVIMLLWDVNELRMIVLCVLFNDEMSDNGERLVVGEEYAGVSQKIS